MIKYCPLYSSSSGNSTYVADSSGGILIDAGMSCKSIMAALAMKNIDCSSIKALFITHEHTDHIKGLKVLMKKINVPIYASPKTLEYMIDNDLIPPKSNLIETKSTVEIGDMQVKKFDTPHDSVHSQGYSIAFSNGRKISIATDLGHVSKEVMENLSGSDLVMLESNYDGAMLKCSSYQYFLKRRIDSTVGHLSNDDCANEIVRLAKLGTSRFVLAHLSRENNMPLLARETTYTALLENNMKEFVDFSLYVAPSSQPGEVIEI